MAGNIFSGHSHDDLGFNEQWNACPIGGMATMPITFDDLSVPKAHDLQKKRVFDLLVAFVLLVAAAPLMLVISVIIKATSRGPILFRQPRVGLNGVMFRCYKFRTMHEAATDLRAERQTEIADPRVTAAGHWLRRLSLDELPQLWNVLKGDMSLVGPRPHAPATKAAGHVFPDVVPGYDRRHLVRPGITGLAQISGCRGRTDQVEQILRRVAWDFTYIERMSLWLDVKILWFTVTREIVSAKAF